MVVVTIYSRYILTWNEGTRCCLKRPALGMIYPHMKWGNQELSRLKLNTDDIPSYEMMGLRFLLPVSLLYRYILIWNEGTCLFLYPGNDISIYPYMKWGNKLKKLLNKLFNDISLYEMREHLVYMRFSAILNISLCNLHKSLLLSSSHI